MCRLGYFFFNYAGSGVNAILIIKAFIYGFIFDINAILYINVVFIILSLLPFKFIFSKVYQAFLKVLFLLNCIPLFFSIADFKYAKFTGKRTDSNVFGIKEDITQQFGQMVFDFWYLVIIGIFLVVIMWRFYPKENEKKYLFKPLKSGVLFILFLGLILLGLRGSLGVKPLKPIAAYNKVPTVSDLVLNTPFCIVHTLDKEPLERVDYFKDDEIMKYLPVQYKINSEKRIGENIVLFIMESFSPEFIGHLNDGKGYTPFIDSLAAKGISFRNCFSNGRTSLVAISSILAGIPQLMEESMVTSPYQTNNFFSLPDLLKQYDYDSYFFHGGKNGTMGFDNFSLKLGFSYFGENEYPDKKDYDGSWGIFDGPYLKYIARKLTENDKPFFATIFTLSSHQPYTIPKDKKHLYSNGNEVLNSIAYVDDAVKDFFEIASNEEWFKNTLFIFVADHTHPPVNKEMKSNIDWFRIPLIMYHPQTRLEADTLMPVQQVDILPSITDYFGLDETNLPKFGSSVFDKNPEKRALFYSNQSYYLVGRDYYCQMSGEDFSFYNFSDIPVDPDSSFIDEENRIKAIRQYFNNSLISNSFIKR